MTVAGKSLAELTLRPEVELLLGCARRSSDDETSARVQELLRSNIDWDYLLQLAERHRLMPLVYSHLQSSLPRAVPPAILDRLQNHFYLSAARNHLLAAELSAILKLFNEHDIPVVPYKGPALALELYEDISLRQFGDLDLMVHRGDVERASELLVASGYRKQHQLTRGQEAAFRRSECEHLFYHERARLYVDLHWEFVPGYFSLRLDAEDFWPRLRESRFEGVPTLAFGPEDLLLILSVHAAKEFWERLIWLCDLFELTGAHPQLDWQQLIERARDAGARRMLLLSLTLVRDLFGATLPAEIIAAASADPTVLSLAAEIEQLLFQETIKPGGVSRFTWPVRSLERRRDRINFRLRLALTPSPEDWAFARLPDQLLPLYFLLRPVRLARKYLLGR